MFFFCISSGSSAGGTQQRHVAGEGQVQEEQAAADLLPGPAEKVLVLWAVQEKTPRIGKLVQLCVVYVL